MSEKQLEITGPVIWVLGGPGCGKGTQCDKIVAKYGFTHLSSGDLLRAEVATGSERSQQINEIMKRGELIPLDIILTLLREAMSKVVDTKGFLIDGYPREKDQGILFEEKVAKVSVILFFEADDKVLTDRILYRGKTSGRSDDNEETIKLRLQTFHRYTDQITEHYASVLKKINAERNPDDIFAEVQSYLDPLVK